MWSSECAPAPWLGTAARAPILSRTPSQVRSPLQPCDEGLYVPKVSYPVCGPHGNACNLYYCHLSKFPVFFCYKPYSVSEYLAKFLFVFLRWIPIKLQSLRVSAVEKISPADLQGSTTSSSQGLPQQPCTFALALTPQFQGLISVSILSTTN